MTRFDKIVITFAISIALVVVGGGGLSLDNTATVVATNSNWSSVTVYSVREGNSPIRIGTVETGRTEKLKVYGVDGSQYSFMLKPIATKDPFVTSSIAISPGDTIILNIKNYLPFTTILPK